MLHWVIGYDITDARRLQRVYRAVLRYAIPLELSVFLLTGHERDMQRCLEEISSLIDPKSDDLRCYPLPNRGLQERIGKATLPAGIHWSGLPIEKN
ncbi:MAG TPA: CRISPR-associated endonuclease Cas2 [Nitrosomonas nitrosa]|jgi:CRISPR-associated protein Cas2|uniref:CRISPR-associated endoribonuclease Cas2 n=1 Tax=Nitrosomonas nitrosa TaxID=52442 RepID=A0A1I4LNZ6_9PROT|nr:CRISPR-associated endonuclease Cas2 [Nitrosomonas nitrosa]MCO6435356.1 CRISPR-associated endonuclease Cas2 [Nitrosomonas nitrosa]PTR04998.1 CRISPR-associated Cas2 family protein [Nitrosomonas nitrosa]CAE6485512.1 CRISPR-associated endoribonuclease Cas2 1 [Nitrosomonas nitrosa]SFL92631.1 CRISPR-associated protein, Cas2 family [Nitrosomonas nitrosa]HBZ30625.1 CRISPR-associated endonuclease Cas2 [Nitrosomonas nitrosa]